MNLGHINTGAIIYPCIYPLRMDTLIPHSPYTNTNHNKQNKRKCSNSSLALALRPSPQDRIICMNETENITPC